MTPNPSAPDTTIEPGDLVRSFDFPETNADSFLDGSVLMILHPGEVHEITGATFDDCDRYVIVVTDGSRTSRPGFVYPPVNGTPTTFGRVTFGVVKRPG